MTQHAERRGARRRIIYGLILLWIAVTGGLLIAGIATSTPSGSTTNCDWPWRRGNYCSNARLMSAAYLSGLSGFLLAYVTNEWVIRGERSRLVRWTKAALHWLRVTLRG